MIRKNLKSIGLIWTVSILSSALIAAYFYFFPPGNLEKHVPHGSVEVLERHFDGPLYVVLAKTLYDPKEISKINFNGLPPEYYPHHFPLLPIIIRLTSPVTGSYFRSLIAISWISAALFTSMFFIFIKSFKLAKNPLLLSMISLFLPPRWLAVRTIGGTEPLFLLFLITCLYFWFRKKYLLCAIPAALLVLTRPPGIIFFFGLLIATFTVSKTKKDLVKNLKKRWTLALMPLAILLLFSLYLLIFGSFLAYFKAPTPEQFSFIPFSFTLNSNSPITEGYFYLFIVYLYGIYLLWKQNQKELAIISLVYLLPFMFIAVDDAFRFLLPIAPFAIIIAYQKVFAHKTFLFFAPIFLIGIYLYTIGILPNRLFIYDDYARLRLIAR